MYTYTHVKLSSWHLANILWEATIEDMIEATTKLAQCQLLLSSSAVVQEVNRSKFLDFYGRKTR